MKRTTIGMILMVLAILLVSMTYYPISAQTKGTIIDEWETIKVPPPPELEPVTVDSGRTALLILDIQNRNCNAGRRPRCVASIEKIKKLLVQARTQGIPVIYSLTSSADKSDIRDEVGPREGEPIVKSGANKFYGTNLEAILREKHIETVIIVGTSAHGAVLNTATGAALRGFEVIIPVDGMSATEPYAEQYTAWHLVNGPGSRSRTTLTRLDLIEF